MDTVFGLTWEQIQLAQQGKDFRGRVDTSVPAKSAATLEDLALLEKHGMQGLVDMQLFGVIDRLSN